MQIDFTELINGKSNDELTEILLKPGDYNPEFVKKAEQELVNRKVDVNSIIQKRENAQELNLEEIGMGKPGNDLLIVVGFILSILGGLVGILIGYIYGFSKKEDRLGNKHYAYDERTRQKGKIMMWIGIVSFTLGIAFRTGI